MLSRKLSIAGITQFCLLAGILTHPIWAWSFKTTFIPKPSDFFFALAMAGSVFYFWGKGRQEFVRIPKLVYVALFLFGFSIVLATFAGYVRYGIPLGGWHKVLYHLFRIGGGFVLFIFVYVALKEGDRFWQMLYHSFWISALPFIPFLFLPVFAKKLGMITEGRFMGFAGNTQMFAVLIFPAFVFIFLLFLRAIFAENAPRSIGKIFLFGSLCLAIFIFILWSGSRQFFGSSILSIMLGTLLAGNFYKAGYKKTLSYAALFLIVVFILLLLPFSATTLNKLKALVQYFEPQEVNQTEGVEDLIGLQQKDHSSEKQQLIVKSTDSNLAGAIYYFTLLKSDPLAFLFGLGINYDSKFSVKLQGGLQAGRGIMSDIFLQGGIWVAAAILLFSWMVWQRIISFFGKSEHRQSADSSSTGIEPIYVFAPALTLLGWFAPTFLFSMFTFIPTWILLGMALSDNLKTQNYNLKLKTFDF